MRGTTLNQPGRPEILQARNFVAAAAVAVLASGPVLAQDSDLAQKLSNPVADLISVPFQYNYNQGYLNGDGAQHLVNFQPVIPISISRDWNLISRTIVPFVSQDDVVPGAGQQQGVGGIVQSLFFSPKAPTANGLIWGAGPVITTPALSDGLGSEQWGLGVTAVGLKVTGPWTVGVLGNHVWSVTDNDRYGEASNTFLQPFVSYTMPTATTISMNTEATYDWENEQWSVPVNAVVAQIVKLGGRPVQLGAGIRYWAASPDNGPEGWGARLVMTFLFPKG